MTTDEGITSIRTEFETGMALLKCQKCGCMENALQSVGTALYSIDTADASALAQDLATWRRSMRPIQYACLGCEYCYPAVAQNAFAQAFPSVTPVADLSCDFRLQSDWPPVVGEYKVLDKSAPVAVSTLASLQLAELLAQRQPRGLALVGKTETENIGIDKIIKNVVTSTTLRHLIVAGIDPEGHRTGNTLLALAANGVDENGRVVGASGKRPILRNVTPAEIQAFRDQVQVIDMIGCEDVDTIAARIQALSQQPVSACGCSEPSECSSHAPISISTASTIVVTDPGEVVKMDPAGYFVILPRAETGMINVEHYAYDNTLLRTIEGSGVRAIYLKLIREGWVTEASHAAYLGKELTKAELSLQHGFKYVQDKA
jgi:tetrahydromethanopterin S-methyltransferase subunit A